MTLPFTDEEFWIVQINYDKAQSSFRGMCVTFNNSSILTPSKTFGLENSTYSQSLNINL